MINLLLIIFGVLLNAVAQILLKKGMTLVGAFSLNLTAFMTAVPLIIKNWYIWGGLFCFAFSLLSWLVVLSRVPVSFAYPFNSLGYLITALAGFYFLGESLDAYKIIGILVICCGIVILSRG